MTFATRYSMLNAKQRQAVDQIDGPVMVLAGPGTGKTELLSMRTANILAKTDTLPGNILCLTFTESGAVAMRERLISIIGADAYKIAIHTFHSFGSEIINHHGEYFYNGAVFHPADELTQYEILTRIFDELPQSSPLASKMNDEYTHLGDTLSSISDFKRSGLLGDELRAQLARVAHDITIAEPILRQLFATRISKATIANAREAARDLLSRASAPTIPTVPPYLQVLSGSLRDTAEQAELIGSTAVLTKWKNTWCKHNDQKELILKTSTRLPKLLEASNIYDSYLLRMQEAKAYDFDDMILRVVHALELFPNLRYDLQEKYQYIMVDEFQDTNMAQMRILSSLTDTSETGNMPNIMAVGDDDQAIYSFQGADVGNIHAFFQLFPSTHIICLTDNYRSDSTILAGARSVIIQGSERLESALEGIDKTLTAHGTFDNPLVELYELPNSASEREWLATRIAVEIASGVAPTDIAVLARRHSELVALLPYLHEHAIPINYERRDNVLDIPCVQHVIGVSRIILALANGQHGEVESLLPEILSHPSFGYVPADLWKLSIKAYQNRQSWMELMGITPEFAPLHEWLIRTSLASLHTPLETMLDTIVGNVDTIADTYKSPIFEFYFSESQLESQPEVYLTYLEALRTLRTRLREYAPDADLRLRDFVNFIDLNIRRGNTITSIRQAGGSDTGVHLLTAHKSKGLEYHSVYILGAIESTWGESVRSRSRLISYPENMPLAGGSDSYDEHMRLFYVAMTRAKCKLTMSYYCYDDGGKKALRVGFLAHERWPAISPIDTPTPRQIIRESELSWYDRLGNTSSGDLASLLSPTLESYKLSVTHLGNFLDVTRGGPRSFLINNLLRFPTAMSPSASYGSAIHAALQRAHSHMSATKERLPVEDILDYFEQLLSEKPLSPLDLDRFKQKGRDALSVFLAEMYESFSPTQKVELNFAGQSVFVGKAHLTGALDLVDIRDGTIDVTDYKTGKPSTSWTGKTDYEKIKLHRYKQQLMFYDLLVSHSRDWAKYTIDQRIIQFVEPTVSGDIVCLRAEYSTDELRQFSKLVHVVWDHIIALDLPDTSHYDQTYKGVVAFEQSLLDSANM